MSNRLKLLPVVVIMTLLFTGQAYVYLRYVVPSFGEKIFDWFGHFLTSNLTAFDANIISLSAIIILVIMSPELWRAPNIKKYTLTCLAAIPSIIVWLLIGIMVAFITWSNESDISFIPDYILYQPTPFYWTPFILLGILSPVFYQKVKSKKRPDLHADVEVTIDTPID